ncbi:MAG: hypothetical protein KatS3mg132_573 [Limisphaera sp.]|nr:MAG: hypothetical protein KatS3mg132_573 [Limisphaera sp.]
MATVSLTLNDGEETFLPGIPLRAFEPGARTPDVRGECGSIDGRSAFCANRSPIISPQNRSPDRSCMQAGNTALLFTWDAGRPWLALQPASGRTRPGHAPG